jgi:hypothetical protein
MSRRVPFIISYASWIFCETPSKYTPSNGCAGSLLSEVRLLFGIAVRRRLRLPSKQHAIEIQRLTPMRSLVRQNRSFVISFMVLAPGESHVLDILHHTGVPLLNRSRLGAGSKFGGLRTEDFHGYC